MRERTRERECHERPTIPSRTSKATRIPSPTIVLVTGYFSSKSLSSRESKFGYCGSQGRNGNSHRLSPQITTTTTTMTAAASTSPSPSAVVRRTKRSARKSTWKIVDLLCKQALSEERSLHRARRAFRGRWDHFMRFSNLGIHMHFAP